MGRKQKSDIRKPQIVQALYQAVRIEGITLPPYKLIEKHAPVSRQLIRHYFPEPEELAVALCDHLADLYKEALLKGILATDNAGRLKMFLDFYFDVLAEAGNPKPRDDSVYDALFALARTSDNVRKNLHDQYWLLQHTLAHEIRISHPQLPMRACADLGFMIVSMMYGHWKMVATLGFDESYAAVSRDGIDRLIESYLARWSDPDENDE